MIVNMFLQLRRPYRKMTTRQSDELTNDKKNNDRQEYYSTRFLGTRWQHWQSTMVFELGDLQQLLGHNSPSTTLRIYICK